MPPFNFLGQDDQKEMQHDISDHVMPLTSQSLDPNGIINGTKAFV